jgi:hypothetical protein
MDETRLTGWLPGLDIEITRRQSPDGAEVVAIALRAVPDFATVAAQLAPGFAPLLSGPSTLGNGGVPPVFLPWMAWAAWWQAMARATWAPWLAMGVWTPIYPSSDETDGPAPR